MLTGGPATLLLAEGASPAPEAQYAASLCAIACFV